MKILLFLSFITLNIMAAEITVNELEYGNCWVQSLDGQFKLVDFVNNKNVILNQSEFENQTASVHCSASGLRLVISKNNICEWFQYEGSSWELMSSGPMMKEDHEVFCHGRVEGEFIGKVKDESTLIKIEQEIENVEYENVYGEYFKFKINEIDKEKLTEIIGDLDENAFQHPVGEFHLLGEF